MIRPLTKEDDLQQLDTLPVEELRPQFVDQMKQVRRKVINRVKPKMLNDEPLTGTMIWDLL